MKKKTRQARLPEDIAEMLGCIAMVKGTSSATILDPLVRSEVTRQYREIEPIVKRIRRAKASVSKAG